VKERVRESDNEKERKVDNERKGERERGKGEEGRWSN
jgi:hypothetical protein